MSAWEQFRGMFDAVASGYVGTFICVVIVIPLYYLVRLITRGKL